MCLHNVVRLSQGVEPGTKAPLLPQYEKEKKSSKFICLFHIGHQSAVVNTSFCMYVCMYACMIVTVVFGGLNVCTM